MNKLHSLSPTIRGGVYLSVKIAIGIGMCMFSLFVSASFSQTTETIQIDTYYPAPYGVYNELRSNKVAVGPNTVMPTSDGELSWTDDPAVGSGTLSTDQGASIELRGDSRRPHIDFSNDLSSNYDARVNLYDDNTVRIYTREKVEVRDYSGSGWSDIEVKDIYICP